jgi:hypothetical protein
MDVAICPGCNQPTTTVFDNGKQVFCQNDDCRTYTAEELANAKEIELPDWLA